MKFFYLFLGLFPVIVCNGQITFERTIGSSNNDLGNSITITSDGGYIIGTSYNEGLAGVIKLNADGDTTWIKTYPSIVMNPSYSSPSSIIETSDGNYVFVGSLSSGQSFICKINSLGDTIWAKSSTGTVFRKVVEDATVNFIVVGEFYYGGGGGQTCCSNLMKKFLPNGQEVYNWTNIQCASSIGCRLNTIAIDSEGNYLVGGLIIDPGMPRQKLAKVSSSGTVVWNKDYYNTFGIITDVIQSIDSGYLFVGHDAGWSADSTLLFKVDKNGNLNWLKRYNAKGWNAISIDSSGSDYFIAGSANGDMFLTKIDSLFNFKWTKVFGGSLTESCNQMKSTSDGGVVMVGSTKSFGAGNDDVYVIKTNENGIILKNTELKNPHMTLNAFPNPFESKLTIQYSLLNETNTVITISDLYTGKVVYQSYIPSDKSEVVIENILIPSGLYVCGLKSDNHIGKQIKIVKMK